MIVVEVKEAMKSIVAMDFFEPFEFEKKERDCESDFARR